MQPNEHHINYIQRMVNVALRRSARIAAKNRRETLERELRDNHDITSTLRHSRNAGPDKLPSETASREIRTGKNVPTRAHVSRENMANGILSGGISKVYQS